jgi:hypothetical protein
MFFARRWSMPPPPPTKAVAVPQPIELRRGGIYVIESTEPLNGEAVKDICGYLKTFEADTGCKFLLLDAGLRIAVADTHD